ncbi:PAS domain S-box-containing protein [Streptomyces sp. 846.5]|nr:SpoIIE family protein phosphatase [Streptomyces sp. 846.5]TDT97984.1 PAS domain S-box-containing protein [Streptomyces sp. 846.5]
MTQSGDSPVRQPEYPFDETATARAVVDVSGAVAEWNGGARQLLGYTREEIVGRPAVDLLAEGQEAAAPAQGATRWDGTVVLRHRDGREVPVQLLAHRTDPGTTSGGTWLLVSALPRPGSDVRPPEDVPRWAFARSPCPVAIYDTELRLLAVNAAMAGVIGLPEEQIRGLRIPEIGGKPQSAELEQQMLRVLATGERLDVETFMRTGGEAREHAWSAHLTPLVDDRGAVHGVCLTAHDITETYLGRRRLQLVNDASVRIGTTLDITRTAEELTEVCVPHLADFVTVDLLDLLDRDDVGEAHVLPPSVDVVLRREAQLSVTPGCPEAAIDLGSTGAYSPSSPHARCLAAGRPVIQALGKHGAHGWPEPGSPRALVVEEYGLHSVMAVPVLARGVTLGVAVFYRHRHPEPFVPDDVLLAEEITARAAVCIDNARRFTRERGTALALQRSLLPQSLPRPAAVEVASRYLPAAPHAGIGGDWFDVIPLSGLRVALVVGDVVGHGIQASATMGRLRTAVRTLADVDLPPDELLTHLDDLVIRLSQETDVGRPAGDVGATCLYAVYDPISRICAMAAAGHPTPALALPDGTVEFVDIPVGPPLGVGGLPFEAVERELPEGALLALYTDGLIEDRLRDIDEGRAALAEALGRPAGTLDSICQTVLDKLCPASGARDDIALLLARTRVLDASRVADWEVEPDPAAVSRIRHLVTDQLAVWQLDELVFTTELVVSELVTNAIRHAAPPIRLRLIHDATLICEVSDSSSTAPHLRRARTTDEGGRGLLLVAQLTQRWGSRHHARGKTIWAEQSLPE